MSKKNSWKKDLCEYERQHKNENYDNNRQKYPHGNSGLNSDYRILVIELSNIHSQPTTDWQKQGRWLVSIALVKSR